MLANFLGKLSIFPIPTPSQMAAACIAPLSQIHITADKLKTNGANTLVPGTGSVVSQTFTLPVSITCKRFYVIGGIPVS